MQEKGVSFVRFPQLKWQRCHFRFSYCGEKRKIIEIIEKGFQAVNYSEAESIYNRARWPLSLFLVKLTKHYNKPRKRKSSGCGNHISPAANLPIIILSSLSLSLGRRQKIHLNKTTEAATIVCSNSARDHHERNKYRRCTTGMGQTRFPPVLHLNQIGNAIAIRTFFSFQFVTFVS